MNTRAPERAPARGGYGGSVLISLVAVGLMSAGGLANNIAIARLAGPEGRGLYGVAVAIGALAVPLVSWGAGPAATWQLGRGRGAGQVLWMLRRSALVGTLVGLLVGGAGWAGLLTQELAVADTALLALACAGLALPAQIVIDLGRGFALGRRRPLLYHACALASVACLLGLNIATASQGAQRVLLNLVIANWVVAILVVGWAVARTARAGVQVQAPAPELQSHWRRYGLRSGLTSLADGALLRIDTLVAAPIVGLEAIGIYAIADQISHLMSLGGILAAKMMLPESAADPSGRESFAKLGLVCRLLVGLLVVGAGVAAGVGQWLIPALFGEAFSPAYLGMLILLPVALFKSVSALVSTWLAGRGVQRPVIQAGAAAVGCEVVCVVGLALSFGWVGVAVGKAVAYALQLGLTLRALNRHLRDQPAVGATRLTWLIRWADLVALRRWVAARLAGSKR